MTLRQHYLLALLILVGTASVMLTYPYLSITMDEHLHAYAGSRWWRGLGFAHQKMNPILPKIFMAAPEYFYRPWQRMQEDDYVYTYKLALTIRRMGLLPFYIGSCIGVFLLSRKIYDSVSVALWSLALYVTTVTVLGFAPYAATDVPYTCMSIWALLAAVVWLEKPETKNSIWLGIAVALLLCTKFSSLAHYPAVILSILLLQAYQRRYSAKEIWMLSPVRIKRFALLSLPVGLLVIGAIYKLNYKMFWGGITALLRVNDHGISIGINRGFFDGSSWYFYPALLLFKTQLALMAAFIYANVLLIQRARKHLDDETVRALFPAVAFAGIVAITMASKIHMGVRHILPVYPLMAIAGGYALHRLMQAGQWQRSVAIFLISYQALTCWGAFPDYTAYYNELAGEHPERIAWDSDYDWGEGIYLLSDAVRERKIEKIYTCIHKGYVTNEALRFLLPTQDLGCDFKSPHYTGWVVLGRSFVVREPWLMKWFGKFTPVARVGQTMDLYYIDPALVPAQDAPSQ